jgi:hypothetical protein
MPHIGCIRNAPIVAREFVLAIRCKSASLERGGLGIPAFGEEILDVENVDIELVSLTPAALSEEVSFARAFDVVAGPWRDGSNRHRPDLVD